jgi:hypothetical protein
MGLIPAVGGGRFSVLGSIPDYARPSIVWKKATTTGV